MQKSKPGFKRSINWNKYQSDPKTYAQKQYINQLTDPSFQVDFLYYLLKMKMVEHHIQNIIFEKQKKTIMLILMVKTFLINQ